MRFCRQSLAIIFIGFIDATRAIKIQASYSNQKDMLQLGSN